MAGHHGVLVTSQLLARRASYWIVTRCRPCCKLQARPPAPPPSAQQWETGAIFTLGLRILEVMQLALAALQSLLL